MTDRLLGPYRLIEELGSGGMGTVHLAEAAEAATGIAAGDRVAVKVVHPQLVSTPGFFKRFMREAEVGKKINHENVVRTFDVDATEFEGKTVLFLVMEYVQGGTLRQLLSELGVVPEALVREIALQVSAGLGAIHGEGIIHRDLKPENVLITDDQQVRIMDLGVAKLQEASVAITKEGQFAGSFLYAAPEQFKSEEVGPPVDLYSLGVMLYELATGANPFRGDDAASVIHAHLDRKPPRVSEVNPDTSEFASEIMATLLAKRAADRFDSADTLHGLLLEGEDSVWWHERATRLKKRERILPPIQIRRDTEVHGRADELAAIQEAWERAKQGEGNTLLVEGEAGIGKTRLVDAFLHALGDDDAHILYGAYPPSGGLGGLSDAILNKFGTTNLDAAIAPYMTVTPSLVPAFAALVKHVSPPAGSDPLQGDALHAVCCHLMRGLAEEHPTVWVIDDLNFAPEESRTLMLSMARAVAGHRILLLLTSRRGLPEEMLAQFGRLPTFKRIGLQRLGARDIVDLLKDAFGSKQLAEKLGGKIGYKSDGVPFFIFEMVRGLKEGQLVQQLPDGTYAQTEAITDIEVPSAVRDLIEARLRGIGEEERNLIDVAAVLGYEFDPDLVARVCEMKRVKVLQKLASLERSPGVVRASGTAYRFDHNQIHELVYAALSPGLRQEYHGLLAEAMAEREGITPDSEGIAPETIVFLATHGMQGGDPRSALPYLRPALDYLETSYRGAAAVKLADAALGVRGLFSGADRVEVLLKKAGCLPAIQGVEALQEALAEAEATGDATLRARTHGSLGSSLTTLARYDESLAHLEKALALADSSTDPAVNPELGLGSRCWYLGEYEKARDYFAEALARAERTGAPTRRSMWGLGLVQWNLGHWDDARTHLQNLETSAREERDRHSEFGAIVNLGPLYAGLGDPEAGKESLRKARDLSVSMGIRFHTAISNHRLGVVAEHWAEPEAAELVHEAVRQAREIEYRAGEAEFLITLARVDPDNARQHLEQARDLATEIGASHLATLARVHLAALPGGDVPGALEAMAEHESRLDMRGRMEARFALWKTTEDRAHLEEAKRLLDYVVEHAPAECRAAMVSNVPLHRDIAAACEL